MGFTLRFHKYQQQRIYEMAENMNIFYNIVHINLLLVFETAIGCSHFE